MTQMGRYSGEQKYPIGSGGEDPIVDEPQGDTYYGNGCKTDILRRNNR